MELCLLRLSLKYGKIKILAFLLDFSLYYFLKIYVCECLPACILCACLVH